MSGSKVKETVQLYEENNTLAEVGSILGITRQAVQQRLIVAGVPRRPPDKSTLLTKTLLTNLYLKRGLSAIQVAKKTGCRRETVIRYLKEYGIKTRTKSAALKLKVKNPDLTKERLEQFYIGEGKTAAEIGQLTGYSQRRVSALLAKYGIEARKTGRRKKAAAPAEIGDGAGNTE